MRALKSSHFIFLFIYIVVFFISFAVFLITFGGLRLALFLFVGIKKRSNREFFRCFFRIVLNKKHALRKKECMEIGNYASTLSVF